MEAEAEAYPYARAEILLEELYRRAAFAYPEALPEPAKQTPAQCKARADRLTGEYKKAEKQFGTESSRFGSKKPSRAVAQAAAKAAAQ